MTRRKGMGKRGGRSGKGRQPERRQAFQVVGASVEAKQELDRVVVVRINGERRRMKLRDVIGLVMRYIAQSRDANAETDR